MRSFLAAVLLAAIGSAVQAQSGTHTGTPTVRAMNRTGPIAVNGRLDEPIWAAGEPAQNFRQQDPREGEPASQRTEVRFVYDEEALYIGARMFDDQGASGVRSRLSRRDQITEGDNIQFVLDTFHDHTGRTVLTISPSGAWGDAGQASSFADPSWDPVWDIATNVDSLGWTAELRLPFSQLRFPIKPDHAWGIQIWRFVERLNEISMWSFWGKTESGGPTRFGHLEGINIAQRKLGLEVLPYVVSRMEDVTPLQAGTPLREPQEYRVRAGADIKALLTSTLTLDATINPDFGQVEVDPAVVNLTAFETFFDEKRPFFIEGSGLFGFGGFSCYFCSNVSSLSMFYSRRIGRRPQGSVPGNPRFVEFPDNSTIVGAAKITGRTAGGWQIGLLNALTSAEDAEAIALDNSRFEQEVEPLSNYFVGRIRRNYLDGNLTIGAMGTSVVRAFDNNALRLLLPGHSEALGTDFSWFWGNRNYNLMGNFAISQVHGDSIAMLRVQQSSARYFDRPDREHGGNGLFTDRFDPRLTTIRGAGGYLRVAKVAGSWLWESAVNLRTPGFENNDLAFITRADYTWMNANLLRVWTRPTRFYRSINVTLGGQQQYNFDGDITDRQVHAAFNTTLSNYWNFSTFGILKPEIDDDRLTRGGAVVRRAANRFVQVGINSDSRKRFVVGTNGSYGWSVEGTHTYSAGINTRFKPASNIAVSFNPNFNRGASNVQYVNRYADPSATNFFGQRSVFASLVQYSLALDTRVSATFSPTLTLELFAQPFASSGEYERYKEFVAPRALQKRLFDAQQLRAVTQAGRIVSYELDPDRNPATPNFSFRNPDFNFRSLRGNAVLRWEYRPGSTLFLVWQQQRSGQQPYGDFDMSRDVDAIFRGHPDNIFLVKMSYWLGR